VVKIKCCRCKRTIASGAEAQKAVVEYRQPDGASKIFGYMMSDGPLGAATGQILRAWHSKCYWIERKREQRGDAVTGRVMGEGMPTGYDISTVVIGREEADALGITEAQGRTTRFLSTRLDALRAIAQQVGKPVGDPTVTEAFRASENGGPYPHTHHMRLDTYQLVPHLLYAHGHAPPWDDINHFHNGLHAAASAQEIKADRAQDPGHTDPPERDWRDQAVIDI
jgi:hypothetical protein